MKTPVKILLDRKREGHELPPSDIHDLIQAYTNGDVPDYQMAAFAMAVCCKGMTDAETLALTEAMRDSGEKMDWADLPIPSADKHSTGGVGDKLSLIIQPLAASCGVAVPSLTAEQPISSSPFPATMRLCLLPISGRLSNLADVP